MSYPCRNCFSYTWFVLLVIAFAKYLLVAAVLALIPVLLRR